MERIVEAEPRLRQVQSWAGAAAVVSVLIGLPGVTGFGSGKSRVPGLTFSHWVFYGPARQSLPVQPRALLIAAATLVAGLALARFGGRVQWAAMSTRLHLPRLARPAGHRLGGGSAGPGWRRSGRGGGSSGPLPDRTPL